MLTFLIGVGLVNQLWFQGMLQQQVPSVDPKKPLVQPQEISSKPQIGQASKPKIFEIGIGDPANGKFYPEFIRLSKEGKIDKFGPENFRSIGSFDRRGNLILVDGCERVNKELVRCKWSSDGENFWLNIKIKDLPMIVLVDKKGDSKFITKNKLQDFINQQDMEISFSPYDPQNRLTPPANIMQIMSKAINKSGVKIFYRDRPSYNTDEGLTNIPEHMTINDKFILLGLKPNGGVLFSNDPTLYPSLRNVAGSGGFLGPVTQGIIQSLPPSIIAFAPGVSIPPSINSGSITIGVGLSFALPWKSVPNAVILVNNQTKPTMLIVVLTLDKQKQPEGYYIVGGKFKITFDPTATKAQDAVQFYIDDKRVSEAEFQKAVKSYTQR